MKTINSMICALLTLLAILTAWQGMHEIYKFEKCEVLEACLSLTVSFNSLFIAFKVFSYTKTDENPNKPDN